MDLAYRNLDESPEIKVSKIDPKDLRINMALDFSGFLSEKTKLINIYNYYTKKMLAIWSLPQVEPSTLIELQNILDITLINIKNFIIDFKDKKPFLILY